MAFASCYAYLYHECETCHELSFADCTQILVPSLLAANTAYTVHLTDKFGNHYQKTITTNGAGAFVLTDGDGLPTGFFNKWAGDIEVKITLLPNSLDFVDINIGGSNKQCIIISIT